MTIFRTKADCQTCHGAVETMERVRQFSDLTMGWCVECHRTANVKGVQGVQTAADAPIPSVWVPKGSESERRNAPLECVTCHH